MRHRTPADSVPTEGVLLAERLVFIDGRPYGFVSQWQYQGTRTDRYGNRNVGRGLPTRWVFTDPDGRAYTDYANPGLARCLFESITVSLGGTV